MIPSKPDEKLTLLIQEAWKLFKYQFCEGRFEITKEAPFQHYFANVIKNLSDLYCFSRSERFVVDLETKESLLASKHKYIDITCSFYEGTKLVTRAAIELKFKKRTQGADDFARIDSYVDIEALEKCLDHGYDVAFFCMISDYDIYSRASREGTTGDIFSMRQGYTPPTNSPIHNPRCKGRSDVSVTLNRTHTFVWENTNNHIFLCMPIHDNSISPS